MENSFGLISSPLKAAQLCPTAGLSCSGNQDVDAALILVSYTRPPIYHLTEAPAGCQFDADSTYLVVAWPGLSTGPSAINYFISLIIVDHRVKW